MSERGETPEVSINGDMSKRVSVDINSMDWQPSPSNTVFRKRLHLVGAPESGQVTSVVMYEKDSEFSAHAHPGGEEILVLAGTFSDDRGDFHAGTYLLNPEGYSHTPYSKEGGVIFVKLRQYPGEGRRQIALSAQETDWEDTENPGISVKTLYSEEGYPEKMRLEKWEPGASPGNVSYPGGAEILLMKGDFQDEYGVYSEMCWLRLPPGSEHFPISQKGCEVYIKTGGVSGLDSV